jgi:hypothetical protein
MTFDVLRKLGRHSTSNLDNVVRKGEMCRDESETSRCCDLSIVEESSSNDDESKYIELKDDLKAKSLQLDILRETLSTMSATMRRQECQLEGKDVQIETYSRLVEEKTIECNEWKERYETLALKIESKVNESEKIQPQPNRNIPTLPASKICDPLNVRRPWKDCTGIRNNITTIRDDASTSSDSISNSYAETGIDARRCPKRSFRSKRHNDIPDTEKLLVLHDTEQQKTSRSTPVEEMVTCDVKECGNPSYKLEDMQQKDDVTMNSDCRFSPAFDIANDDYGMGLESPTAEQESEYESERNVCNVHNDVESVGFSFEVEIPFSDPESVEIPTKCDCDMDAVGSGQTTSEVEILSLDHFIQMYDQYQIEDEEMNCVADLSTAVKDDDAVSVMSNASLDSSTAPTSCKNEHVSMTSLASSSTFKKTNGIADKVKEKRNKTSKEKEAANLRKRIIRTAKREAKKAQFNCEAVEC